MTPIPANNQPARDWELTCDHCNGCGRVIIQRQVAERKSDVQEFKEECECCEGRGFVFAFDDIPGIEQYVKSCRADSVAPGDAQDERQAFEAWSKRANQGYDLTPNVSGRMATYESNTTEHAYRGFFHGMNAPAAPAAGDALPNFDIEAAAQKLAECMDYPWPHMPEQGRTHMRKYAQAVIDAALAAQVPQQGEA